MVQNNFEKKVSLVLSRLVMVIGVGAVFLLTVDIMLLIFAGLLLAVFLVSLAEMFSKYLKLSQGPSLALVVIGFFAAGSIMLVTVAPAISVQVDRLTTLIPQAFQAVLQELERYEWGSILIRETEKQSIARPGALYSRATGVLAGTAGWLVSTVIVLFIGLFAALNPGLYQRGVVRLFPPHRRERVTEIVAAIKHVLQRCRASSKSSSSPCYPSGINSTGFYPPLRVPWVPCYLAPKS